MPRVYDISKNEYKVLRVEYPRSSKCYDTVLKAYKIVSQFMGLKPKISDELSSSNSMALSIRFQGESYDEREKFFTNMLFELETKKCEVA